MGNPNMKSIKCDSQITRNAYYRWKNEQPSPKATNLPTLLKLEAQEKLFPVNSDNQLNDKSEHKRLLAYVIFYRNDPKYSD